jgi:hypothetical protein
MLMAWYSGFSQAGTLTQTDDREVCEQSTDQFLTSWLVILDYQKSA